MTTKKSLPPDYEELGFKIEGEEWNEYELDDGVKIRGRVFLGKIMRDPHNPKEMNFDLAPPKWIVYANTHQRGTPSVELLKDPQKQKDAKKYRIHVDRSHEPWNRYTILRTGQEVKVKLTIDDIYRFQDSYDQNGSPLYQIPNGIAISIKDNEPQRAN